MWVLSLRVVIPLSTVCLVYQVLARRQTLLVLGTKGRSCQRCWIGLWPWDGGGRWTNCAQDPSNNFLLWFLDVALPVWLCRWQSQMEKNGRAGSLDSSASVLPAPVWDDMQCAEIVSVSTVLSIK